MKKYNLYVLITILLLSLALSGTALAKSEYLSKLPAKYASKNCNACHSTIPALNQLGKDWVAAGKNFVDLEKPAEKATPVKPGVKPTIKKTTKKTTAKPTPKPAPMPAPPILVKEYVKNLTDAGYTVETTLGDKPLTREIATFLAVKALALDVKGADSNSLKTFNDAGQVSKSIIPYIAIAIKEGIVLGYDSKKFGFQDMITKDQVKIVLSRLQKKPFPLASRKYAGSDSCKTCHADYYKGWMGTYHSKMVQKRDVGILKDAVVGWAYDSFGNPGPAIGNVTKDKFSLLDVEMVVGSKWKQRYLVKNAKTGGMQLMNKQFNTITKRWENYGNANDWDTMCITCHSTGYRLTKYDEKNPAATQWEVAELNTGCETCHGPASAHIKTADKKDIYNPAKQSVEEQTRLCGYCHIRLDNHHYKSRQGNAREDFPAPTLGDTWKPWVDWTKWYPMMEEHVVIPGVQPEDKVDAEYTGDLKGLFALDEIAKKQGVYEEKKHHQEYQGMLQSKHNGKLTCTTCHNPHKRTVETGSLTAKPEALCAKCHTGKEANWWMKIMPGTGGTAANLFVRTHTFFDGQSRPDAGLTAYGKEPEYYFPKK